MNRRKKWQKVLDAEVQRWSALSCADLVSKLYELPAYEVDFDSKTYQVEVGLLENTERYVHIVVAVDDGGSPGVAVSTNRDLHPRKARSDRLGGSADPGAATALSADAASGSHALCSAL
jgi:hypothetical protein